MENEEIDALMTQAGARMRAEITRALAQGELEFKDMAEKIALDMGRLVLKQILAGMQSQNLAQGLGGGVGGNANNGGSSDAQFAVELTRILQQGSRYI
ncbi:phage tail tape measure C-terminal domain-containing protein [Hirschia litorea]|uniref:Phage tail tape measure C-terminal domain-containing protein n=1 Tax=Hirschia litorea TaxID=1199156 RepID=A0ABW2IJA0_9PROT